MLDPLPGQTPPRRDYMTIAQLTISGLGLVFSLLGAFGMGLLGLVGLTGTSTSSLNIQAMFSMAWICLLTAALAIPSLVYSIKRLSGRGPDLPKVVGFRLASVLILVWPLVLFFGNVLSRQPRLAWLILPPLQLLAVGLPVWLLVEIARRKLAAGSLQRAWGLVNFSIFITTPVLMIVEVLVLLVLGILFAFWASTQPALVSMMQRLLQSLSNNPGQPNPDTILPMLAPYLQNPLVIFSALALVAVIIPLLEELLKPLGLWFLASRRLTPMEGFAAGALCGGAFALLETLFYLSNPIGESWAMLAALRTGTELLHITTTALLGWALAVAWQNGSYVRLGVTYLLSTFLHGMWNALSVLPGLAALNNPPANLRSLLGLARVAPVGNIILVFVLIALLWGSNRLLQDPPKQMNE